MTVTELHLLSESMNHRLYRYEDPTVQRRMLVKELSPEARQNEVLADRLQAEAEFLSTTQHSGFLKVLSKDLANGRLLLEDAQCTLEQLLLRNGPLENDVVTNVILQLLDALHFLHSHGLAHGSLTASRVFVDPFGTVKLGDVLPYRYSSESPLTDQKLDLKYRAPEVIDSAFGDAGPASDLYSLGYLMLEMFSASTFPHLFGLAIDHATPTVKWQQWHADPQRTIRGWRDSYPQVAGALAAIIDELTVKDAHFRSTLTCKGLLERISKLGLQSRRTLPMFEVRAEISKPAVHEFVAPARLVPPVLMLRPKSHPGKPLRFATRQPVIVGNDPEVTCPVFDDLVDVRHAAFICQRTTWYLYDLQSRAGTQVNRHPIEGVSRVLRPGDEVTFGESAFVVDLEWRGTSLIPSMDLLHRVHRGATGDLYRATWHRPGGSTQVALRLYAVPTENQGDPIRRLIRYVEESKKLRHPYIVQLYKAGMVRRRGDDTWYMANEFMSGRSLRDKLARLRKKRLSPRQVRQIGLEIASALRASESRGLLHRNINPGCILFTTARVKNKPGATYREVAKLGDFLLVRPEVLETLHQITQGRLKLGDYIYQSPELLSGSPDLRITSDLYSLAVCLYEALTGKLPLAEGKSLRDTLSLLHAHVWLPPSDYIPTLTREWDDFFRIALAKEPASRFPTAEQFSAALSRLVFET